MAMLAPRSSFSKGQVSTPTEHPQTAAPNPQWPANNQNDWLSALLGEPLHPQSTTQPPTRPTAPTVPEPHGTPLGSNALVDRTFSRDNSPMGRSSAPNSPHHSLHSVSSPRGSGSFPSPLSPTRASSLRLAHPDSVGPVVSAPSAPSTSSSTSAPAPKATFRKKSKTPIVPINPLTSGLRMRGRKKSAIILNLRPGAPPPAPLPHGTVFPGRLPPGVTIASAPECPKASTSSVSSSPEERRNSANPLPPTEDKAEQEPQTDSESERYRGCSLVTGSGETAVPKYRPKLRGATLEADTRSLNQRVQDLVAENELLERENGWLRAGMLSRNPELVASVGQILKDAEPGSAIEAYVEVIGPSKAAASGAPVPPPVIAQAAADVVSLAGLEDSDDDDRGSGTALE